ncbi:hypothetical protein [Pseudaestuariivita atlantica]|uniref:Uncharacterized protein n=1 Tax=Pseudaestuariivita atlantica TaxID=1317121 RepID=A0A0L1JKH7_9RHOB|nr:hypothetical protein [Pseudaestuariivita atlantica]KNG92255.1 hypothetical protein ATO11_18020 [Pseudaestuariivita atlantica]
MSLKSILEREGSLSLHLKSFEEADATIAALEEVVESRQLSVLREAQTLAKSSAEKFSMLTGENDKEPSDDTPPIKVSIVFHGFEIYSFEFLPFIEMNIEINVTMPL